MLAQMDDEGIERAVYYFSKRMLAYEENYSAIEKTDCAMYVKKCHKCQIHANLQHLPPVELHNLGRSLHGDIIGTVTPKASNGHEYIVVAIDYFTKWVES